MRTRELEICPASIKNLGGTVTFPGAESFICTTKSPLRQAGGSHPFSPRKAARFFLFLKNSRRFNLRHHRIELKSGSAHPNREESRRLFSLPWQVLWQCGPPRPQPHRRRYRKES